MSPSSSLILNDPCELCRPVAGDTAYRKNISAGYKYGEDLYLRVTKGGRRRKFFSKKCFLQKKSGRPIPVVQPAGVMIFLVLNGR
jgi:hypothetical protein